MTQANGTSPSNFNYVEIFNSSNITVSSSMAVETKKYLFLTDGSKKKLYAIAKDSNYRAMTTAEEWKDNIISIVTSMYNTDFPSPGSASNVFAVLDSVNDNKRQFSIMSLSLSNITVRCHPLTSLSCFWVSEETEKMEFLVMGVNDEFDHVSEIRYTFNVYNIYSYGTVGTLFWLLIITYAIIIVALFSYRIVRLSFKRFFQMKRIDGLNKIFTKHDQIYRTPLKEYKGEIDPQHPEDSARPSGISLELTANEVIS